ncbi:hypothetical protein SLEP1_g16107 [Rubroshorea leprosula]|uniref:Uncharacterized protein n=1 Tax=Rubroshorea leprosula TaxID=152421 RepID=A0AAV5ITS9_9ROSI|nr:hypothetical protein SLEP1_g16107 [Rubroshorea leprosula]
MVSFSAKLVTCWISETIKVHFRCLEKLNICFQLKGHCQSCQEQEEAELLG